MNTQAIDFTLAFPQADLEVPVYMELPAGMELEDGTDTSSRYILKLRKSFYGLKQTSLNWHNMLKAALLNRGFVEPISDHVYITKDLIVLVYVDDCILISKEQSAITAFVQSLHNGPENFVFTKEGTLESYLEVCIIT